MVDFAGSPLRPRWVYTDSDGAVDYLMSTPQRPWNFGSRGLGGSDTSAAGVPAAYEIRRDHLLHLTLRLPESEWDDVERLVRHLQRAGSATFYPDQDDTSVAHTVYGDSPKLGEEITPRRSGFPAILELDISIRRTTDAIFTDPYYGDLLFHWQAGTRADGMVFTRTGPAYFIDRDGLLQIAATGVERTEYVGAAPTLLLEDARTNVVLWDRDLTNAAWAKVNTTTVKDQTGPDGVASSATSLTAAAGNATWLQAITLGSSARYQSAYVKRITGSGVIQMTMDNGSTWTAITVTSEWNRVTIPTQTIANPQVGFRIVTNADAIAVDFVQNENGTFESSVIATTTVAVTRGAELCSFPFGFKPQEMTLYLKFVERGGVDISDVRVLHLGASASNNDSLQINASSNKYRGFYQSGPSNRFATLTGAGPSISDTVELLLPLTSAGVVSLTQEVAGVRQTASGSALALPSAWAAQTLFMGSRGSANKTFALFESLKIARGVTRTLEQMRVMFS